MLIRTSELELPRKTVRCQNVSCWVCFCYYFLPLLCFGHCARFFNASCLIQLISRLSSSGQMFLEICNMVRLLIEVLRLSGHFLNFLPWSCPPHHHLAFHVSFGFASSLLFSSFSHCPFVLVIHCRVTNDTKME